MSQRLYDLILTYARWDHCMKNVLIWSLSGPYFPAFELISRDMEYLFVLSPNVEKYGSEKLRIRTLFM